MTESKVPAALKKVSDLNKTEKMAIVLQALHKEGYNDNQASHLLEVSRARVCQVHKKIDKGVLNPLVNKARKAVKLVLEGKAVGEAAPKASDVLTAAKMVLDRVDPIINKVESSQTIAHTYELKDEDRAKYKKALGIIDAEYEILPPNQKLIPHSPSPDIIIESEPSGVDDTGYSAGGDSGDTDSGGLGADAVDVSDTLEHISRDEPIPREEATQ